VSGRSRGVGRGVQMQVHIGPSPGGVGAMRMHIQVCIHVASIG
jgi:hypothetical protein